MRALTLVFLALLCAALLQTSEGKWFRRKDTKNKEHQQHKGSKYPDFYADYKKPEDKEHHSAPKEHHQSLTKDHQPSPTKNHQHSLPKDQHQKPTVYRYNYPEARNDGRDVERRIAYQHTSKRRRYT
ncbi:unnamed protein product [Dibothriocephalus latus]|uniref:Uncharacterized protein n=1 Tax=Dibothriocephalus latus TaxID=60516 RepID=A0A3P7LY73_DIBLA|nr:unnamed protein product [Dibothriocephalus latus]